MSWSAQQRRQQLPFPWLVYLHRTARCCPPHDFNVPLPQYGRYLPDLQLPQRMPHLFANSGHFWILTMQIFWHDGVWNACFMHPEHHHFDNLLKTCFKVLLAAFIKHAKPIIATFFVKLCCRSTCNGFVLTDIHVHFTYPASIFFILLLIVQLSTIISMSSLSSVIIFLLLFVCTCSCLCSDLYW